MSNVKAVAEAIELYSALINPRKANSLKMAKQQGGRRVAVSKYKEDDIHDWRGKLMNWTNSQSSTNLFASQSFHASHGSSTNEKKLQKQLDDAMEELRLLEEKLMMAAELGNDLLLKNQNLEAEADDVTQDLLEAEKLNSDIQAELDDQKARFTKLEAQEEFLRSQITKAENQNDLLLKEISEKEDVLKESKSKLSEFTSLKTKYSKLQREITNLENSKIDLDEARILILDLKKANSKLKNQLSSSQSENVAMEANTKFIEEELGRLKKLETKYHDMEHQLHVLKSENEELSKYSLDNTNTSELIKSLLTLNQSLSNESQIDKDALEAAQGHIGKLQHAISNVIPNLEVIRSGKENENSDSSVSNVSNAELEKAKKQLGDSNSKIESLLKEIESLKEESDSFRTSRATIEEARKNLAEKLAQEMKKSEELDTLLHKAQDELSTANGVINECSSSKTDLEKELEAIQKSQDAAEATMIMLKEKAFKAETEAKQAVTNSENLVVSSAEKNKEIENLKKEIERLRALLAKLQGELDETKLKMLEMTPVVVHVEEDKPEKPEKEEKEIKSEALVEEKEDPPYIFPERKVIINFLNETLRKDQDLQDVLPVLDSDSILKSVGSGLLLCKLLNILIPGAIDERVLNKKVTSPALALQNHNLCINTAKGLGINVSVSSKDLVGENKVDKKNVWDFIWDLIYVGICSTISLKNYPELIQIVDSTDEEKLAEFSHYSGGTKLLHWYHYILNSNNLNKDAYNKIPEARRFSTAYGVILSAVASDKVGKIEFENSSSDRDIADIIIDSFENKLGANIFGINSNLLISMSEKSSILLNSWLLKNYIGLEKPSEEEEKTIVAKVIHEDHQDDAREERTFRMWINSLGIQSYVHSLDTDLRDGLVMLQVFDKISPGIVNWAKVNLNPAHKFAMVENCNMVVKAGKDLRYSLVGISGPDFVAGQRTAALALIWQAMRYHFLRVISQLHSTDESGKGKQVSERDMIKWANRMVVAQDKETRLKNFRDKSLSNSLFLIDLIAAVDPTAIDYSNVAPGENETEKEENAKYVINAARKVGAALFLSWEDIVEVKPKMILSLIAALMLLNKNSPAK